MAVDVTDLIQDVQDYAAQVRDEAVDRVLSDCQDACPVSQPDPSGRHPAPGGLRDSLTITDVADESPIFSAAIVSDLPYAQFTDTVDTVGHVIGDDQRGKPGGGPFLTFWWDIGPQGPAIYEFATVNHPGTTGQHWFEEPMPGRWEDALQTAAGL